MHPPGDEISAPEFPPDTQWLNAKVVRVSTLLGRHAILVWFWDYTSLNSLRALPYIDEWHRRYADHGLAVLGVHCAQFDFGKRQQNVTAAIEHLGIEFPVALDRDLAVWRLYGVEVWPSLYLWNRRGVLSYFHFAEGEYRATEEAIAASLREIDDQLALPEPMEPLRATDAPDAAVLAPTPHRYMNEERLPRAVEAGDELATRYSGAGAYVVLDGRGKVDIVIDGEPRRTIQLQGPRLYELAEHDGHEEHELKLRFRNEALVYAFSFAAGVAAPG
jgi:hypothetical protein